MINLKKANILFLLKIMSISQIKKEDLIDIDENKPIEEQELKEEKESDAPQQSYPVSVPRKNIRELTEEERQFLIKEAKEGKENELYKVTFCKNGVVKIVKRKEKKPSVSQKFIKENTDSRVQGLKTSTLSNEQLLMEHVINLEAQFATLKEKHKKLKKSYKQLSKDIYIDEDEISTPVTNHEVNKVVQEETPPQIEQVQPQTRFPKMKASGWRQKMMNNLGY